MGATELLSRFVVDCESDSISDTAREQVRRSLLDTLGTMLAGSSDPAGVLIADFVVQQSSGGKAWLAGRSERTSPMLAALANGTMAHALDFDDTSFFGHSGVSLIPASLAVAEYVGSSGRELLDALVLGMEVSGRTREGMGMEPYDLGYHSTPLLGIFGATAAASRLLRLDVDQLRCALGIVGSLASGVCANFGTMTKPLHAGECGRAAIEAVMLARTGFTACSEILESEKGFGDTTLRGAGFDPHRVIAGLGASPLIAERSSAMKKYPCCFANHAALDGTFRLLADHPLQATDVATVHITGAPIIRETLLYDHPADGPQGKFSMKYNVALAFVDRRISQSSFTEDHIRDPRLTEFIDKVSVEPREGWEPWTRARIEIVTTRGERIVHDQEFIEGDHDHPLPWSTIVGKYRDNASTVLDNTTVGESVQLVERLEELVTVHQLIACLADRVVA